MKKTDIIKFAETWKNISDYTIDKMKEDIKKLKRKSTKELLKNTEKIISSTHLQQN